MGDNPDFHVDDAAGFPILERKRDDPTELVSSPATQSGTFSFKKEQIKIIFIMAPEKSLIP